MKKNIFSRNQEQSAQSGGQGLRRFRVPRSLSVALVSGMLATGSCGGGSTSALDGAGSDVKVEVAADVADAGAPDASAPDQAADTMVAMDTTPDLVPPMPDGPAEMIRDALTPDDLGVDFPLV